MSQQSEGDPARNRENPTASVSDSHKHGALDADVRSQEGGSRFRSSYCSFIKRWISKPPPTHPVLGFHFLLLPSNPICCCSKVGNPKETESLDKYMDDSPKFLQALFWDVKKSERDHLGVVVFFKKLNSGQW